MEFTLAVPPTPLPVAYFQVLQARPPFWFKQNDPDASCRSRLILHQNSSAAAIAPPFLPKAPVGLHRWPPGFFLLSSTVGVRCILSRKASHRCHPKPDITGHASASAHEPAYQSGRLVKARSIGLSTYSICPDFTLKTTRSDKRYKCGRCTFLKYR